MGEDAEVQIRIFIEDFPFGILSRAEMRGDKFRVGAGFFGVLADAVRGRRGRDL